MSLSVSPPRLPRHVAIIMDGNGRWAKARGLPRVAGHRQGADAVRRTLVAAGELGIPYLTLFGFSSENWKRPPDEVDSLMGLLRHYLRSEIAELHSHGVRLRVIGERDRPMISRVYLDVGGREAGGRLSNGVKRMADQLEGRGYEKGQFLYRYEERAGHNEQAWRRRLPRALRFMMKK